MTKKTYNSIYAELTLQNTAEWVEEKNFNYPDYVYLIKNFV